MNPLPQTGRKMKELEYALMTTETSGLAQMPVHLVRILGIDEDQNAWFAIPLPSQQKEAFGEQISVQLDFYKKGKPFYLSVEGSADLITDMAAVPDTDEFQSLRTMLWKGSAAAVKVNIEKAEIFGEPAEEKNETPRSIAGVLASWYAWLFAPVLTVDR